MHLEFLPEMPAEVDGDHSESPAIIQMHRIQDLVEKGLDQAEMSREVTGEVHLEDRLVEVVIQTTLSRS